MALKIRLRQQGRKNRIVFRLVLSDTRFPRDGKYLETLGWYNPHEDEQEKSLHVDGTRVMHWIKMGAELTPKAVNLVKKGAPEVIQEVTKLKEQARQKATEKKREARKKKIAALAA